MVNYVVPDDVIFNIFAKIYKTKEIKITFEPLQ